MKLRIPYNIFIFIWSLFGIAIFTYSLSKDFIIYRFANISRLELIVYFNILFLLLLYVFKYLKHRKKIKKLT